MHRPTERARVVDLVGVELDLEHTQVSVEEICAEIGYEDASFFRHIFKRTTKLTPSEYRLSRELVGT